MDDSKANLILLQIMNDLLARKAEEFIKIKCTHTSELHIPIQNHFTPPLSGGKYFNPFEPPLPILSYIPNESEFILGYCDSPTEKRKLLKRIK